MKLRCFQLNSDVVFVREPGVLAVVVKKQSAEIYEPGCQLVKTLTGHLRF